MKAEQNSKATSRRIKALEQSDPVHARCATPRFTMAKIVGIEFGRAQSAYMDEIHLATDIDFGAVTIRIGDYSYSLSLASALILLEKTNASVVPGSKYSDIQAEGEIAVKSADSSKNERGGGIEGEVGAGTSFLAKAKGAIHLKSDKAHEASQKITHRIALVVPEGQDGWRVGGPHGNRLLQTKDLRGPAINSRQGDDASPLCTLTAINPDLPVNGRIRVQAALTDFRLRGAAREADALETVGEGIESDQANFGKREKIAEQDLRERVAAMALLKPLRRAEADEGLFDIASRRFFFLPEMPHGESE